MLYTFGGAWYNGCMRYFDELELMKSAVVEAWEIFKNEEMNVSDKGAYDLVTNIDKDMERFISARIREKFPADKIVGEEFNAEYGLPTGRAWVIDPVDGTVNMAHGLGIYGVQVAFFDGGEVVASLIYLPTFGETYTAVKGEGAYLNGKRTHVRERSLNNAMVSIGDCSHKPQYIQDIKDCVEGKLKPKIGKFRNFGAASFDFACLASGRTDGYILFTKNLWDIYPGLLVSAEAGAKIVSPTGEDYDYYRDEGICALAGSALVDVLKD